jgi:hypothetical protein
MSSQYVAEAPRPDRGSPFPKPQMAGGGEHVKWEYHDFVGKYHLRNIKSEFPIPGLTITRKLQAQAAAREHSEQLQEWMKLTHKSNTAGIHLKTEAEADFLTLSDTGRASERVLAALAPAIEKRAEAFHKFTHAEKVERGRATGAPSLYLSPYREEDALELDHRRVDPVRDFRFGIMPEQRQHEIHHLNLARGEFQPKAVDVLTTDKLITVVVGKPRGPPDPVRETKTRVLSATYRKRSGFSRGRLLRQEAAEQRFTEERAIEEQRGNHRALTRCTSAPTTRLIGDAGAGGAQGGAAGNVVSLARAGIGAAGGGAQLDATAEDDLLQIYHAHSNTSTVATREFRRRNRFL